MKSRYCLSNQKECTNCHTEKGLSEFYDKPNSKDGKFSLCKACHNAKGKKRRRTKSNEKEWLENERKRQREKYHRLKYNNKQKPDYRKNSRYKNLSRKFPLKKGLEHHHWNYNFEFLEDTIILDTFTHARLHNFLTLNKETLVFSNHKGEVLDTKEKHINFINSMLNSL